MLNAKRLMSIVLVLAMVVTMASFPVTAAESLIPIRVTAANSPAADGSKTIDKAADGDESTFYATSGYIGNTGNASTPYNLKFELPAVSKLGALELYWSGSGWGYMPAENYKVYVSADDVDYTEILSYEGLISSSPDYNGKIVYSGTVGSGNYKARVTETGLSIENVKYIKVEVIGWKLRAALAEIKVSILKEAIPTSYTVNYVDAEGNPVADAKVVDNNVYVDDVVTETAVAVAGYEATEASKELTLVDGENVITFTYNKLPDFNYTVKYVDVNGNPIAPEKTGVAVSPYEVTEMPVYVDGYYKPAAIKKTIAVDGEVIEFVYDIAPEKMVNSVDDLLKNAKATASSSYKTSSGVKTPVENLIDNNAGTYWQSNAWSSGNPNDTVTIDLGAPFDINEISIKWLDSGTTGMLWINGGASRSTKYEISVSTDGVTYTPVYLYDDPAKTRVEITDTITASDFIVAPRDVQYIKIKNTRNRVGGRSGIYELDVYGYAVTDRITSITDYQYYAKGSTAVNFPFTVMTLDSTTPNYFDAANWALTNCTIDSVTVENVSDPASNYYTWNVNVKAIPDTTAEYFALDLDLPASYKLTDSINFRREASDLLFDSAIAEGDNAILLDKTSLNIEYNADGSIKTSLFDRMVNATIRVQYVLENGLPYKGYNDVVVEVAELKANGEKVRFDFEEDFVRVGDEYYGTFTFAKGGVERFEATIVLYGVNADGTKVELDKKTIFSEMINISETYPKEKTDAQKAVDYTHGPDILDQLIGQVHPYDLPIFSEGDWEFYKEVLVARGVKNTETDPQADNIIKNLKKMVEDELAKVEDPTWVAPDYSDDIIIDNHRIESNGSYKTIIRMGGSAWNVLKDLHVNSFSVRGPLEHPNSSNPNFEYLKNETIIEDFFVTFRNGIDYDYTNSLVASFCVRMKDVGASAEYANVDLRKGYNAVRRALNDDQVNPIMFRLDWYNWPSASTPNPFTGGVITVKVTDDWINNNGMFNLATYHMSGYKYSEDNDPELTLMKDKVSVSNYLDRYVSVEIEGDAALYDSYVIVGTDKLPSELPETVGTYFDVE